MKSILDFQEFKRQIVEYKAHRPEKVEKEAEDADQSDQRMAFEQKRFFKLS